MIQLLLAIRSKVRNLLTAFNLSLSCRWHFASRIKHRHNTFWNAENAEIARNEPLSSDSPLAKWTEGEHWQKKLSNKYNAREFARIHGCKAACLYWKGRDVNAIDWTRMPPYHVIRPTIGHSCQHVFLMANSVNLMDKKTYSGDDIKTVLGDALKQNPYAEFLIEEFVRTEKGEHKIPDDYKFYAFNGEVAIIEVINRLGARSGLVSYYDKDWNRMADIVSIKKYAKGEYQEPPACFSEMMEQAKRLSRAYEIFVRIDFYATDKGCVFGEFTPTPGSAKYFTVKGNKLLIKYWDKYCKGKI